VAGLTNDDRIQVVMAGPLPPAIGGMTSVIQDLYESALRDVVKLELFDTGKATAPDRTLVQAVTTRLALWRRWWTALGRPGRRVAHIHTCSGLSFFLDGALVLIARLRGVAVVLHVHGGRFDAFLAALGPLRRWIARRIARMAAHVIVLSDIWRDRLAPHLPDVRWTVVENGVPVPKTVDRTQQADEPTVVFVGAVCRAKGIEDLVRAAGRMQLAARVVCVGPEAESGMFSDMRRLAVELGVAHRLEFVGPKIGLEKTQWLARATVFVLPSHAEALPISMLEAMAAGCPVVATSVGAIPTVVRHELTGMLVAPGDVDALAATLDRVLSDEALRARLSTQGRQECGARFGIDRVVDQLQRIYADATDARALAASTSGWQSR